MGRIQVLTDDAEHEAFRAQARREGRSLSDWLREAGRRRLEESRPPRLRTEEDLAAFFDVLDRRHADEPDEDDWHVQKAKIAASRVDGLPPGR